MSFGCHFKRKNHCLRKHSPVFGPAIVKTAIWWWAIVSAGSGGGSLVVTVGRIELITCTNTDYFGAQGQCLFFLGLYKWSLGDLCGCSQIDSAPVQHSTIQTASSSPSSDYAWVWTCYYIFSFIVNRWSSLSFPFSSLPSVQKENTAWYLNTKYHFF